MTTETKTYYKKLTDCILHYFRKNIMIKYIAVGILAYMFFAGVFNVKFSEFEVGIGFNPIKIVESLESDFNTFVLTLN